jgi:uncharacterized protein YkwD
MIRVAVLMVLQARRWAGLAILAFLLFPSGDGGGAMTRSHATSTSAAAHTTGPTDPEVVSFVKLMNAHRRSLGLSPLAWDPRAAAVAKAHSRDMFERDYFSHTSPDGRKMRDRLEARGITYSEAGENIAWGQETGRAVLTAWLRSPGHRQNIERPGYTHHGVAKVGPYWTHVFIRPADASPSAPIAGYH